MKPSHLTRLLALFVFLALAVVGFAAVPQTINYQGYLKNTDGTPVNIATSMRFSLYSSNPSRNNPVWRETKSITPSNGIYSTQLGSVTPISASFDVPYWLGIKVGGDSEMALQALSSVPYARRAAGVDAGTQTLLTGAAVNVGLIVKGSASQTADLQQWQNSTGSTVASVSPVGDLTITGNLNLPATTPNAGVITAGGIPLIHSFGTTNFFSGRNAGNLTMVGTFNVGSGYNALSSNTNGYRNTAFGANSLNANGSGSDNAANGNAALAHNTSGYSNTANGALSLYSNTTGHSNTASGYSALYANTSGNNNTAVGAEALSLNSTGLANTACGVASLQNNTEGIGNVAMGLNSLNKNTVGGFNNAYGNVALFANTTGSNNAAFGSSALRENTTGTGNTALGYQAGYSATPANANTTGTNNTFIGYNSGPGAATQLSNATAIGYNALVSQSNSLVLGGTGADAVKVGIGTKAPTETLDVVGTTRINDNDIYLRSGTDRLHGLGFYGSGKTFAAINVNGPALYGNGGGVLGSTDGTTQVSALRWDAAGNVGIGTATPGARLDVAGTVQATAFSGNGAGLTGLSLNTGNLSGTLSIAQGGTGVTSAAAAIVNLGAAAATHYHDTLYQRKYARTAVVARDGGDYANPLQAMDALSSWCGSPSVDNPCLLRIMPGGYNIATNSLEMRPYVDIEGAGENMTMIRGTIDSGVAGVVVGASNAELRNMTVENTGAANGNSIALFNLNVSPKISHVTLKASANGNAETIHNETSSLTLSDVTLATSSNNVCQGLRNWNSTTSMTNVRITTGSACSGDGIYNDSESIGGASLIANNLDIVVSNLVGPCHGIYNYGGKIELLDSSISAANRPDSYDAIYNRAGNIVRVVSSKLDGYVYDPRSEIIYEGVHAFEGPQVYHIDKYRISGPALVQAGSESTTALIVRGHTNVMSANLQEWWDRDVGIAVASISQAGDMSLPYGKLSIGNLEPWDKTETLNIVGNLKVYGGTVITDTPIPAANLDLSGRVAKSGDTMTGTLSLPADGLNVGAGQLVISGGKVGIGTSSPTERLDVVGNIRLNDNDIFLRSGSDALHGLGFYGGGKNFAGSDVNGPALYGNGGGALGTINGGTQRIALSWNVANNVSVQGDLTAQGDLTVNSIPTGSTQFVLCSSLANRGVVQRCSASSRKLKENIADLSLGLDTVNKLRPVSFIWKANKNEDIGFIAEEVAAMQPVLAIYNEEGEPDGVKYATMSAVLVKAVQEQQQAIERQKARIDAQGAMIDELKADLVALKAMMNR